MSFIEGVGRDQHTLFPAVLDDYISSDHPVRFIDVYVARLDLAGLGFEARPLPRPDGPATILAICSGSTSMDT